MNVKTFLINIHSHFFLLLHMNVAQSALELHKFE